LVYLAGRTGIDRGDYSPRPAAAAQMSIHPDARAIQMNAPETKIEENDDNNTRSEETKCQRQL
jgi:hypothetical protein